MQFNLPGDNQGLVPETLFLAGANTTAPYALSDITRNINVALQDVSRFIWETDAYWQYDDSNNNDLPIAIRSLGDASASYSIPTTAQKIHRVEVIDSNGNYTKLEPIDYRDIGVGLTERFQSAGLPIFYDLVGSQITLYPSPSSTSVTLTNGLELRVSRDVTLFTTASTTAVPGFAPQFHRILSASAALDFAKDPQVRQMLIEIKDRMEKGIKNMYSSRMAEVRPQIRPVSKSRWRQWL